MNCPKVKSLKATNEHTLLVVEFDNQQRQYDATPLFSPLQNAALFKSVKVDMGGYALVWNELLILVNLSYGGMGDAI